MRNKAMQKKLAARKCVDLSNCRRIAHYYVLGEFKEGVDYCDARNEWWIWSIGRTTKALSFRRDGVTYMIPAGLVIASTGSELYQHPGVECLFLR